MKRHKDVEITCAQFSPGYLLTWQLTGKSKLKSIFYLMIFLIFLIFYMTKGLKTYRSHHTGITMHLCPTVVLHVLTGGVTTSERGPSI